jgi:arylesterase / paraoxonase
VENFSGIKGDGTMNLHGFDIRHDKNTDVLHILLINHRPPIDLEHGEPLDATIIGANSTIEHFRTEVDSDSMRHVRTYANALIQTPNRVAWATDDSFVFTNDHSVKVGFVSSLF